MIIRSFTYLIPGEDGPGYMHTIEQTNQLLAFNCPQPNPIRNSASDDGCSSSEALVQLRRLLPHIFPSRHVQNQQLLAATPPHT